jgi:methyl-accepting chemotaxis protein
MTLKNSITAKFIAVLLLVLVIGQGLGAVLFITYTRTNLMASLQARMERLAKQSAGVIAEPILNYNLPVLDAYLKEALADPDIVAMTIFDAGGKVINEKSSGNEDRKTFTAASDVRIDDNTLGRIEIVYTTRTIDETMTRNLLVIPAYQLAMLVGVAVILIRMFNVHVKNPVARINRALAQVTAGNLAVDLPIGSRDEIGTIAEGVRFLVERLAATIARINAIALNVSEAMQQLTRTFERVTGVVSDQQVSIGEVAGAVQSASESQKMVVAHTEQLLSLSSDNSSALLELRATSEEIAGSAERLNDNINNSYTTLTQLTESSRQVVTMADEVSSAIENSSASVEEIFRSLKEVEQIVRESARLSDLTTSIISEKGVVAVEDAAKSMASIESFIAVLTASIDGMGGRPQSIGKVLAVIGEVTDQLQLLSLNAQIIAAQAGNHGQGFAVVADEMRELSGRTATSTREIESIVCAIQGEIMGVVRGAQDAVKVVRESREVVNRTSEVFQETLHSSRQATEMSRRIELASMEQNRGLEMVVSAIEQVKSRIFQVNRAMVEQTQNTAYLLRNLSPIRESMNLTQGATKEQVRSVRLIGDNIELANSKTAEISNGSQQQQQVNTQILGATESLLKLAAETAAQVKGNAASLTSLDAEIAMLKNELRQFKNSNSHPPSITTPDRPPFPSVS